MSSLKSCKGGLPIWWWSKKATVYERTLRSSPLARRQRSHAHTMACVVNVNATPCQMPQRGVPPAGVVEALYILEDRRPGDLPIRPREGGSALV